jgi:hypothetical protein
MSIFVLNAPIPNQLFASFHSNPGYSSIFAKKILTMKFNLSFALVLLVNAFFSQSVKSEELTYGFIKLPTHPVNPKPNSYQSFVTASYEAENQKKIAQFESDKALAESDYQREMAEYPNRLKAADEKFEREMKAWNEKSTASKIIENKLLNENNKPVKDYIPQPYRRSVSAPILKTSYDYNSLASTYLTLDGYSKGTSNDLTYSVNIQGFEHSNPTVLSEVKKEATRVNNVSTTTDVTYYYLTFTYRHAMSFRVATGQGLEVFASTPPELSEFKTYKGPSTKTAPSTDITMVIKPIEDKILQDNLKFINNLVNDRIGYAKTDRKTELFYVKSKNESHADLQEASLGFKLYANSEQQGAKKLEEAVVIWKRALEESDPENKKARIDKDITIAIYFNLLEAYFIGRNTADGEMAIKALKALGLSNREKRTLEQYEELFVDLTLRKAANGL